MLVAVVAHAPKFGAKVPSFDAAKARTLPGVVDVGQIPTGAVLADARWTALKRREALSVQWDERRRDARQHRAHGGVQSTRRKAGLVTLNDRDVAVALDKANKKVAGGFEVPISRWNR